MKRTLSKFEEASVEFFRQHQSSIDFAREMVRKTLFGLKFRKQVIVWFDLSDTTNVSHIKNQVIISTSARLSQEHVHAMETQEIQITFFVSLEASPPIVEPISFDRTTAQMSVNLNFKTFPSVAVSAIEKSIKEHVFGFNAESAFYEKFLLPLRKRFPEQIVYVHPAGQRKDLTEGIDFVVGYKDEETSHSIEVAFQYKTSFRYVQKHKKRYPTVSLFVAHTKTLDDLYKLKGHFFIFLKKHLKQKVVIPEKDFS